MTNTAQRQPIRRATSATVWRTGLALAGLTALVSGVSVFVNGYGVARFDDATTYTTAKNLVAAVLVTAILVVQRRRRAFTSGATPPTPATTRNPRTFASLAAVAVIGGSVPFVLFFEGLARVSSSDAAFVHKTLVVWVAILAVLFLGERVAVPHLVAIVLILAGYAQLAGGVGFPEIGSGEALIMAATLCWSVEVVLVRSLLRRGVPEMVVGTSRMAGGIVLLLGWAIVRGALGDLLGLSATQWAWTSAAVAQEWSQKRQTTVVASSSALSSSHSAQDSVSSSSSESSKVGIVSSKSSARTSSHFFPSSR